MFLLGTFIFVLLHSIQMPTVSGFERDREDHAVDLLATMSRAKRSASIDMSQMVESRWSFKEWRDAETDKLWDGDTSKKKYSHSGSILETTNGDRYVLELWNGRVWFGTRSVKAYETGERETLPRGPIALGHLVHAFMTVAEIVTEIVRRTDTP